MPNKTFTIIKPEIIERGDAGKVIDAIIEGGFRFISMKMHRFSREEAERFYAIHRERPFFGGLITYITSGPVIVGIVEKEHAVNEFRKLIGATNPAEAAEGTIRQKFGTSIEQNAVHGSDSGENAALEASYFFPLFEQF